MNRGTQHIPGDPVVDQATIALSCKVNQELWVQFTYTVTDEEERWTLNRGGGVRHRG